VNTRLNNYAPPAYNGLAGDGAPTGFIDVDFSYVYSQALTASQFLRDQALNTTTDADFIWRALMVTSNTGAFSIRFSDAQGYYLSNAMLASPNFFLGTLAIVFPVFPEIVIPAGGRIGIDIQDVSAAPNTVEITFRGAKRYRMVA
jgi:hypothetical protein